MRERKLNAFDTLSDQLAVCIRSCREERHDPAWHETKQHGDYDLWYLLSGRMFIAEGGRLFEAQAGDAVLFYPHQTYRAFAAGGGCRFIYTHFDIELGGRSAALNDYPLSGVIPGHLIETEAPIYRQACTAYQSGAPMAGMALKGGMLLLLAGMLRAYGEHRYSGGFGLPQGDRPRADWSALEPVFTHIAGNLHRPLRNYELADKAGMSEKYFIAYFKRAVGMTPGRYISQLRMDKARVLLGKRTASVMQIADLLGYPDAPSFSKAFKKHHGVPPSRCFSRSDD